MSLSRRVFRLTLLVALGVGGYAAFQLVPGWLQFISGRETALLRRQAGLFFVDALLIAYPWAAVLSASGTAVLVFLRCASPIEAATAKRSGFMEKPLAGAAASSLRFHDAEPRFP